MGSGRIDQVRERLAGLPASPMGHTMLRSLTQEERLIDDAGKRCAIALADGVLAERIGPEARKWAGGMAEISRERARGILAYVLNRDLAYSTEPSPFFRSAGEAARVADDLISCFSDDANFFSNGRPQTGDHGEVVGLNSWVPVTGATFDWGVVMCDQRYVGYVWAESED